jgi:hypothetical protein
MLAGRLIVFAAACSLASSSDCGAGGRQLPTRFVPQMGRSVFAVPALIKLRDIRLFSCAFKLFWQNWKGAPASELHISKCLSSIAGRSEFRERYAAKLVCVDNNSAAAACMETIVESILPYDVPLDQKSLVCYNENWPAPHYRLFPIEQQQNDKRIEDDDDEFPIKEESPVVGKNNYIDYFFGEE